MLTLQFLIAVIAGKLTVFASRILRLGAGGTWPGEIALTLHPHILTQFTSQLKQGLVLVAGTNGKTTTSLMIQTILESEGKTVIHNKSGANLENGLISAFIQQSSVLGKIKADYAVLEVDENSLPLVVEELKVKSEKLKVIVLLLNLFRDQLDRYGEVDVIAKKWQKALLTLSRESTVILNSDDPQIAHLAEHTKAKVMYFGLDLPKKQKKELEHATDSTHCLSCGSELSYEGIYYSHLGKWKCNSCGSKRPKPDLVNYETSLLGLYNRYNATAAGAVAQSLGIKSERVTKVLKSIQPAFGRQEEFTIDNKQVKIFLSKNPTGFNESLRTVLDLNARHILLVLNDRIPDGRDVSWIWDVDFEMIPEDTQIFISGDRAWDMGLRMKYTGGDPSTPSSRNSDFAPSFAKASKDKQDDTLVGNSITSESNTKVEPNLNVAIQSAVERAGNDETLFILPTYSAMLEVREILTGRKIL